MDLVLKLKADCALGNLTHMQTHFLSFFCGFHNVLSVKSPSREVLRHKSPAQGLLHPPAVSQAPVPGEALTECLLVKITSSWNVREVFRKGKLLSLLFGS